MPSYNCGKYVEKTIRSVQAQTYSNWEIIFMDDFSNDNTIRIVSDIREKDKRIHLYQNNGNMGAAMTRNIALRKSNGRWIAFLDSDDIWEPDKLEKQISFMENHGYSFSYTCYQEIDSDSNNTGVFVSGPQHITKQGMYNFCWPGCLTVMYDSSKIGLIQINDIRKNNDYAMWLKVCNKADCYLLDECLAKYRRGRSGSVSSHSIKTMIGWHYKLWHEAEGKSVLSSIWHTGVNLVFGLYKKLRYVHKC
jgi:glycosyltransferase involved in cell wall biosynthesis